IPAEVHVVCFDAVGTLLFPREPVAATYARVGQKHGSRYPVEEVRARFGAAFAREEELDRNDGWRTDEPREVERWRRIVAAVLDDAGDPEACFRDLYAHFAQPSAWRCAEGTADVLRELTARGHVLAIASNFD